jgi:DNA-directed RNA polymerase sigma subunit (sigma70/sigma32)
MRGKKKPTANIDLGLAIIAARSCPPHTHEELAAYCGVSWQAIRNIEQRALKKLRLKLYCQKIRSFSDLSDS